MDGICKVDRPIGGGEDVQMDVTYSFDCDTSPHFGRATLVGKAVKQTRLLVSTEWRAGDVLFVGRPTKIKCKKLNCETAFKWSVDVSVPIYLNVRKTFTGFIWGAVFTVEDEGERRAGSADFTLTTDCICCDPPLVVDQTQAPAK